MPVLLAKGRFTRFDHTGSECHAAWEKAGGALFVIAANPLRKAQDLAIQLSEQNATEARVMFVKDETVKTVSGVLTDQFGPLAVRVYRISTDSCDPGNAE